MVTMRVGGAAVVVAGLMVGALGCGDDSGGTGGSGSGGATAASSGTGGDGSSISAATTVGSTTGGSTTGGEGGGGGGDGGGGGGGGECVWEPGDVDWAACPNGGTCGELMVPLDWEEPCGEQIPIMMRRLPAAIPSQRIGAILVNPGGPGRPGLDYATSVATALGPDVTDRFDLIGFDPRGVGASGQLSCGSSVDPWADFDLTPDTEEEKAALLAGHLQFAADCGENGGPLLGAVSTRAVVQDMEAIRRYLQDDTISYYGSSYGAYLGARYADRYPDRVRAFLLDSASDPTNSQLDKVVAQGEGFELAFEAFLEQCALDVLCPFHNDGDPTSAFVDLMSQLDAEPLPVDLAGEYLTETRARIVVFYSMYRDTRWGELSAALAAAQAGDGDPLYDMSVGLIDEPGTAGDHGAYRCADHGHPTGEEFEAVALALETSAPLLGRSLGLEYYYCSAWPVPPAADDSPAVAPGSQPILVVGVTGDAATPYAGSVALAEQLESGVLVTYEGYYHAPVRTNECLLAIVRPYFLDLEVPAPGISCP